MVQALCQYITLNKIKIKKPLHDTANSDWTFFCLLLFPKREPYGDFRLSVGINSRLYFEFFLLHLFI